VGVGIANLASVCTVYEIARLSTRFRRCTETIINCLGLVQPKKGAVLQDVARVLDLIKFVVF